MAYLGIIYPLHGLEELMVVAGYGIRVFLKHTKQGASLERKTGGVFNINVTLAAFTFNTGIGDRTDWILVLPRTEKYPRIDNLVSIATPQFVDLLYSSTD